MAHGQQPVRVQATLNSCRARPEVQTIMLAQAAACKPLPAASMAGSPSKGASPAKISPRICSRRARAAVTAAATAAAPAAGRAAVSTAFEEYILDLQQRIIQVGRGRLVTSFAAASCLAASNAASTGAFQRSARLCSLVSHTT